jgi:hypothetical protein
LEAAEEREGEIAFEVAFVEFVEDDAIDAAEFGIAQQAAGEDAFGDEAKPGARAGGIFEADLIADSFADSLAALGRDEAGGQARGEAARFEDDDVKAGVEQRCRDARGFAGAGCGLDDERLFGVQMPDDFRQ